MSSPNKIYIEKNVIEEAIELTPTMGAAAKYLNLDWRTFKMIAEEYDVYSPKPGNQYGRKFELIDVFNGKYPQYPTAKLSKRLISEGYKLYKCERCGISSWNGESISLELNHIDGNNSNHELKNLELLCPNCHSQTPTYRSKNVKLKKQQKKEVA